MMFFNIFPPLLLIIPTVFALCTYDEKCETALCKEVSRNFRASINLDIDPCDNFYDFVCSGWKNSHPGTEHYENNYRKAVKEVIDRIRYAIENHYGPIHDSEELQQLHALYNGCMQQDTKHMAESMKTLRNILKGIGGCPFIGDRLIQFDVATALSTMAKEFAINDVIFSMLTIKYLSPETGTQKFIPYFLPPTLALKKESENELLKNYLKSYIKDMFFDRMGIMFNVSAFDEQIEKMISFEKSLSKLISIKCYRYPETIMNVSEIQAEIGNKLDFTKLMKNIHTKVSDINNLPVAIDDIKYIKDVAELIKQTDEITLANYLSWRIINNLKEYLPSSSHNPSIYCINVIFEHMEFAVAHLYESVYVSNKMKNDVTDMTEDIKSIYLNALKHVTWLDSDTAKNAQSKIKNLNASVGYPQFVRAKSIVEGYYRDLGTLDETRFFESILKCRKHIGNERSRLLHIEPRIRFEFPQIHLQVKVEYIPLANHISIPISNLIFPFYDYELPAWLKFGGIGSEIAQRMHHAIDLEGNFFDEDGNYIEKPWGSAEAREKYGLNAKCLEEQYNELILFYNVGRSVVNGSTALHQNAADNVGLEIVLRGYEKYVEKHGQSSNKGLPHLDLTPQQLFYVAFAYKFCGKETYSEEDKSIYSPFKIRVLGSLINTPKFQEHFQCKQGKWMYREKNICLFPN